VLLDEQAPLNKLPAVCCWCIALLACSTDCCPEVIRGLLDGGDNVWCLTVCTVHDCWCMQVSYQDGMGPMDADGDMSWLPAAAAVDVPDDVYLRGKRHMQPAHPSQSTVQTQAYMSPHPGSQLLCWHYALAGLSCIHLHTLCLR
jgi:hypothetical protein